MKNHGDGRSAFPTCVGMNRTNTAILYRLRCVPHVRGDEPFPGMNMPTGTRAFPTCVGMNRSKSGIRNPFSERSPRAWG